MVLYYKMRRQKGDVNIDPETRTVVENRNADTEPREEIQ